MPKKEPNSPSKKNQSKNYRRLFCSEFDLILKPPTDKTKITVAVSKKIAARAVDRNRIKRIIKEAVRLDNLNGSLVFIIKKNIAGLKTYQVKELIVKHLKNND